MASRKESTASARRRLGRGLGSLISAPASVEIEPLPAGKQPAGAVRAGTPPTLPIKAIRPNPSQPRRDFDERSLAALAESIRSAGVMQPVVVRGQAGGYELVAGERRWRAAQMAGLEEIPAIIRDADDRQAAELSFVENLQREDLNAIERAEAFRRLIDDFGLKHQEVGEIVGMDRSTVTNHLRLLELAPEIKEVIRAGLLGLGHARPLLSLDDEGERRRLAAKAAREGWSVRGLEREIARRSGGGTAEQQKPISARRANVADLDRRLSDHLGTKARIRPGKKKGSGSLTIEFYDFQQFEGLMQRLGFRMDPPD